MEAKKAISQRASPEARVLQMIRVLLTELGSHQALRRVTLEASLERDLGIGSLERVELLLRLEKEFSIRLADRVMTEAETPAHLVKALLVHHSGRPENLRAAQILSTPEAPRFSFDPASAATLDEVLRQYAQGEPKRPHIHLRRPDGEIRTISYGKLFDGASAVASGLLERGLEHGQTVAVMLPTCEDFFLAFFGILLAGGVPVPIYPPFRPDRLEEYAERQSLILRNAEVRLLITFQKAERLLRLLRPRIPSLSAVTTVDSLGKTPGKPIPENSAREDVALIQYTSGSTGDPKGVVLTHANLIANIRGIGQAIHIGPTDVGVSWLPLYHDMGLIGSWLCSLYFGFPITILSPLDFLSRPERWLWAIHDYRATLSAGPNFAYELCVRKIDPSVLEGLDLSCWRAAFNGAEPVSPETLTRFSQRFGPYGFRPETLLPVYGLAEASVALTVPPLGRIPRVDLIDRARFEQKQKAEPCHSSKRSSLRFVSVGRPLSEHEVRVADDEGVQVEERRQGHIQFRGPSTMAGYFRNPAATRQVLRNGWVDTGDLGYQAEGELFITARLKDVIIKAGRNLYPQEVEEVTSEVEGVRRGCVAAFGVSDAKMGTERLVVVAETRESDSQARDRITSEIIAHVDSSLGIPPDIVHLVPPQTVPKTSSGKIRRDACRTLYLQGDLTARRLPPWLQLLRLFGLSARDWTKLWLGRSVGIVYGFYVWLVLAVVLVPGWVLTLVSPGAPTSKAASNILRFFCRLGLRISGLWPQVEGQEYLAKTEWLRSGCGLPLLLVSNHASYFDPVIVAATVPFDVRFVAKQEAASWPIIGTFIRKCGYLTVNRNDPQAAASASQNIAQALRQGLSVHIFPEGTFTRQTGLRPFQMGAFKAAVETGSFILPVTLCGTRKIFRDETWLPRPGPLKVVFGSPLSPREKNWREMVRLRDATREEILKYCGESSVDLVLAGLPKE